MNMERRRHPRFKVRVPVELGMEGSNASIHAETIDLSLSGCYVAMPFPLEVGTTVEITLRLEAVRVAAVGLVATCHRGLGNGIGFEKMLLEDHEKLMHYLEAVKEGQPSPESPRI